MVKKGQTQKKTEVHDSVVGVGLVAGLIMLIGLGAGLWSWQQQARLARDRMRMEALKSLKTAFLEYEEAVGCVPEESVVQSCESRALRPHLPRIPCDPMTGEPYGYDRKSCRRFALSAFLEEPGEFVGGLVEVCEGEECYVKDGKLHMVGVVEQEPWE